MLRVLICLLLLLHASAASAQCTIDSSQTAAGIYPDSLPPATTGQFYSQDITFVMLTDTLGLTINNYQITSISGLPVGLTWTCNNAGSNCNYDPSVSLFGCINISGTPLVPGSFVLSVQVQVSIQLVGNQAVSFTRPLDVLPAASSNSGFSTLNGTGCAPLTVSFINNLPGQAAYLWDFGNGIQSTLEQPPAQTFTAPGTYIIRQDVTPNTTPSYFLTNIEVAGIPNNYGGFVDDPDLYFLLLDPNGQQVYDSRPAVDNTFPPVNWPVPNILLNPGSYSLQVWDEDGGLFGADDDLGTVSFNGNGSSGTATGTISGVSGQLVVNYTIFQTPVNIQTSYDTIEVYARPAVPLVTPNINPPAVCAGTAITLTCSDTLHALQWEENGNPITGADSVVYSPPAGGLYTVTTTTANGCTATSSPLSVTYFPLPVKPTFLINNNVFTTFVTGYDLQWYLNGTAIPGAVNASYTALQSGIYRLCATDTNGCENCSDSLVYAVAGIGVPAAAAVTIYPNPNNGTFRVQGLPAGEPALLTVYNQLGQPVYRHRTTDRQFRSELPSGLYHVEIQIARTTYTTRLLIQPTTQF